MIDNAAILVCSRRKSSRIPDKAFYKICGIPTIKHIENRLYSKGFDLWFLVPPEERTEYGNVLDKGYIWAGYPESPLHRMAYFLKGYPKYEYIIRVTGDDIIPDLETIESMYYACIKYGYGYAYSPDIIEGAGVEIIHRDNILYAAENREEPTEFISYFVKGKGLPVDTVYKFKPRQNICRSYRLTLDYPEDCIVIEAVLRELGTDASVDEICRFLDHKTEILNINKQPKYSFYTCVYNGSAFIAETIRSVLNIDADFEYIIVDDASTDGTLTEIAKYAADPRIKLVLNQSNQGLASSSNIAINKAKGQYIMRIDADDTINKTDFERGLNDMSGMISGGYDLVYPAFNEMDKEGFLLSTKPVMPSVNNHAGCCLMSKRFINEMRFKEGIKHWDSYELFLRVKPFAKIGYYTEPIWCYRRHDKCMSKTNLESRAKIKAEIEGNLIKIKKNASKKD